MPDGLSESVSSSGKVGATQMASRPKELEQYKCVWVSLLPHAFLSRAHNRWSKRTSSLFGEESIWLLVSRRPRAPLLSPRQNKQLRARQLYERLLGRERERERKKDWFTRASRLSPRQTHIDPHYLDHRAPFHGWNSPPSPSSWFLYTGSCSDATASTHPYYYTITWRNTKVLRPFICFTSDWRRDTTIFNWKMSLCQESLCKLDEAGSLLFELCSSTYAQYINPLNFCVNRHPYLPTRVVLEHDSNRYLLDTFISLSK